MYSTPEQILIMKAYEIISEVKPIIARKYGIEPVSPKITISNKMKVVFGHASFNGGLYAIKLSGYVYLGKENTAAYRNTVIHEYMHLMEYQIRGEMGHSPFWASLMELCGEKAAQNPTIEKKEEVGYSYIRKTRKIYEHLCGCKTHMVGIKIHNKILKGAKYKCLACKTHLS